MLSTWMGCPLQARFRYLDKLPDEANAYSAFGSCVHHALDHYNTHGDVDLAVRVFEEVWDDPALIDRAFEYWPPYTSFATMLNRGREMIREYHDKQKWEERLVIASEHKFNVPFGDHRLSGIVDLLEMKKSGRGKSTLKIVDYKTNSKAPNRTELKLNIQFTAYQWASLQPEFWLGDEEGPGMPNGENLWDKLKDSPRRTFWYQLSQNKEIPCGERDTKDFMRLYRAITEVAKAWEAQIFVPNISGSTCIYCPYTDPCGVPVPQEEKEEALDTLF